MTRQHINHRGFATQVIAHETFPANAPALAGDYWYACSAVISRGTQLHIAIMKNSRIQTGFLSRNNMLLIMALALPRTSVTTKFCMTT